MVDSSPMNIWDKIWKTTRLIGEAWYAICWELLEYFTNPFPFIRVLKVLLSVNRGIRIIWVRRAGRKPLSEEIRKLIIELKSLNRGWGGQRISDELKKIGIDVSKKTVLKILREEGLIIPPPHGGLGWDEFIKNHSLGIGIDFTCVFDLLGRQYFIFVILNLEKRTLMHINVTLHPTRQWVTQQFRNTFMDFDAQPSFCLSDRDGIFGMWLKPMLQSYFGMKLIQIPYKMPWFNGRVERFHRSLKREAMAYVIPISVFQLQSICWQYKSYYNGFRCHQALAGKVPESSLPIPSTNRTAFARKLHLNGHITTLEPIFTAAA